jgi:hypothetical protein
MKKAFRLTVDFTAEIFESVEGIRGNKLREYIREVVAGFLSDPCLQEEIFKHLLYWRYLSDIDSSRSMRRFLGVKNEFEILGSLIPMVSPETAYHLKTLCNPEYRDFEYEGEDGTMLDFILGQFPLFQCSDAMLTELRNREVDEDAAVVLHESHSCQRDMEELKGGLSR